MHFGNLCAVLSRVCKDSPGIIMRGILCCANIIVLWVRLRMCDCESVIMSIHPAVLQLIFIIYFQFVLMAFGVEWTIRGIRYKHCVDCNECKMRGLVFSQQQTAHAARLLY
jgi:hypothetical protein